MSCEASDRASGQLRRGTNADAEALVALHERALRDAGTDPGDVPEREDLRDIEGEYLAAGGEFLVVEDEGEIVAMGGHRPVDDATIELFRIAVAPERQRAGLGDRVVSALEVRGQKAGFDRVRLETVVEQDAAANFYPARGYEETARGPSASGRYTLLTFEKPCSSDPRVPRNWCAWPTRCLESIRDTCACPTFCGKTKW